MSTIIFVGLLMLYMVVATHVEAWKMLSGLGLKMETPLGFLKYPYLYFLAPWAIFLAACVFNFSLPMEWYLPTLALCAFWYVSRSMGREHACKVCRQSLHEMISSAETSEELIRYEAFLKKTDEEIISFAFNAASTRSDGAQRTVIAGFVPRYLKAGANKLITWVAALAALAIVFIILNGAIWIFGETVAPLLWTTTNDRKCQNQGYWYASTTANPDTIQCSTWMLLPGKHGRH